MVSYEQFTIEFASLRQALELRRRKYIRYFHAGLAAGLFLLVPAWFYPEKILHFLQRPLHSALPLTYSDIAAYRGFALLCSLLLALAPILSYRRAHGLSVGHAVLARLLNLFGAFIPASGGGISSAELKTDGYGTAPFLFYPEQGASGEMNAVRVRICEASLLARHPESGDRLVFHGLVILCDALARMKKTAAASAALPQEALHEQLARVAGMKTIHSPACWDEKLLYAAEGLYTRMKEAVISGMGKNELPSEKLYRLKYHLPQRLARYGQPKSEEALLTSYSVEYSEQGCLILVAGVTDFFVLGSLFAPVWDEARVRRFFEVMQLLDTITRHLPARV